MLSSRVVFTATLRVAGFGRPAAPLQPKAVRRAASNSTYRLVHRSFSDHSRPTRCTTVCSAIRSRRARRRCFVFKQQTISLEHFADPELAIDSRLRTRLDQRTHLGGGAVNFAGIFWSFEDNEHRFYCVVQAHDEALSRAAFKLIEDNEPESFACVNEYARALLSESAAFQADLDRRRATNNSVDLTEIARVAEEELQESSTTTKRRSKSRDPYTTWYEMFFRNERMREISRLQSEHRARIACLTMKEAGVGPVRCNASDTEMITAVLEHPSTIHSAFNCIEQVDAENRWSDVVYLSNLTSAWAATSAGVAIRASLDDEGVTLFRGKPSPPRFAAEQRWPFIGLPIATGPVYSPSLAVRLANPFTESRTVLWSLKQQPHHMLAAENWRSRKTETWLQWERDCGITSERGVTLKPARVRVVDPTGAAVSQRETIYRKTQ